MPTASVLQALNVFCNWEVAAISEIEKFNLGLSIKRFSDNFNIS